MCVCVYTHAYMYIYVTIVKCNASKEMETKYM